METLRKAVIELVEKAQEKRNEETLLTESLKLFLAKLQNISCKKEHEMQSGIRILCKEFCIFFLACLTILRSGQQLDRIGGMEKSFKAKEQEIHIQFLNLVLAPLCLQADKNAIEITAYFLHAYPAEVATCARKILSTAGQNPQGKNLVTEILKGYLPSRTCALSLLAEVDAEVANTYAIKLVKNKDELIRHEALWVLAKTTLSKDICDKMVEHLKGIHSKVLWEDSDHHLVIINFIQNAFTSGFLSKEDAKILIAKAFEKEGGNRGLAELLPVAKLIDPGDKQLVFEGFLAMESKNPNGFLIREESVKKFLLTLRGPKRIEYLQKSLLSSSNRKFAWFAGQRLLAANIHAAAETFVACAKAKDASKEKIFVMAQLAMKACNDEKDSDHWDVTELNKGSKLRFAPVAQALLAYAETAECPTHVRLAIAFQPGMFGGNVKCRQQANALLEKIVLDKNASSAQVLEALQALLNCRVQKKTLANDVEAILKKAYASDLKERFLDQLLEIMVNDIRGYPMEPLFRPAVAFLENIDPVDSIPMLEKALHAKLPDGDLGLEARALYVSALKKFALKGRVAAVVAIADYYGGNISSEVIPKTLTDIYRESSLAEVKKIVAKNVAKRFLFSITKETDTRVFYLYELEAVEVLKDEPLVQEAFLEGIVAIGNIASRRSKGMCNIVKKVSTIMPQEQELRVQETLKQLIAELATARQLWVDKRGRPDRDEYVIVIDAISAEAGMAMMGL